MARLNATVPWLRSSGATAPSGMEGFVVLAMTEQDGEVFISVEMTADVVIVGVVEFEPSGMVARCTQPDRRLDARFQLDLDHRVAAHPRRHCHRGLATAAQHLRCCTRHDPAVHLVHMGQGHLEESRKPLLGDLHTARILRAV